MEYKNGVYDFAVCPACTKTDNWTGGDNHITVRDFPAGMTSRNAPVGTGGWSYDVSLDDNGELWYHIPFGRGGCVILHHQYIEDRMERPYADIHKLREEDESIEC